MQHILVTGGLGFIGVHLLKHLTDDRDVCMHPQRRQFFAWMTHFDELVPEEAKARITNYIEDINNQQLIASILKENDVRLVYHLAAESHVDRSISGPKAFFGSNVMGTLSVVEV